MFSPKYQRLNHCNCGASLKIRQESFPQGREATARNRQEHRMGRVAVIGYAATPVGRLQPRTGDAGSLEHEVLADVVLRAVEMAQVDKSDIGGLSFAQPRPYTQQ